MAKSRKLLTLGAVGVAAIALIGAGASATFTDTTTSNQTVKAGTIDMRLTSPAAGSQNAKTINLPDVGPTNSTFVSNRDIITMTNHGTVQANAIYLGISSSPANGAGMALQGQLSVCIFSDPSGTSSGGVIFNGLVNTLAAMGGGLGQQIEGPFAPDGTDNYSVEFYAGTNTTKCGNATYGGTYDTPASLTDAAQGGVVGTSVTVKYVG